MHIQVKRLTVSALFLALAMVLPFLTGQIPQVGAMLSPMHIPVLLCGFVCGGPWGALVGFIAPLLRFALFGMPPIFPTGVAMAFELAVYGLVSGLLYRALPKKTVNVYISLIAAMVAGRIVWGIVRFILAGISGGSFPMSAFIAGAITGALPGIVLHIVLIPLLVLALRKANLMLN